MNDKSSKLKQFPRFETDEEAENFVGEADLSEYDFSGFTPLSHFEFQPPQNQSDALKTERQGIPYRQFIRGLLQKGMEAMRVPEARAPLQRLGGQ